jgi:membrane associated rhomboid family serine protease
MLALAATAAIGSASGSASLALACSGAIAAALGGYLVLYPRARVLTMFFLLLFATLIELPVLLLLGMWVAQQVYYDTTPLAAPLGEWCAFALGAALVWAVARGRRAVSARAPVY